MHNAAVTDGTGQPLTAAGIAAPAAGLDISGLAPAASGYTITIEVQALSAASGTPIARIVAEDSVDAFTSSVQLGEWVFTGPIAAGVPVKVSAMNYGAPGLRIGVASAKLRFRALSLAGTTPSLTFSGSLSY